MIPETDLQTRPQTDGHTRTDQDVVAGKPDPTAHLTPKDIEDIGRELDAIREQVMASRGTADAQYIRRIITAHRSLEAASRLVLLFSKFPPAFVLGTLGLSLAKIVENTEIGHNILHGQWDWMRDEKIHSSTWEWDHSSPSEQWKESHNVQHHTYTNILGKDNDLGYNVLRVDPDQEWKLPHLFQPFTNFLTALVFEYGITAYDLDLSGWKNGTKDPEQFRADLAKVLKKLRHQLGKDFVVHPLLSGPSAPTTLLANVIANATRNVWAHAVIFCGHFPEGIQTFQKDSLENETRGQWYVRQMLGSGNFSGPRIMHIMSGHLSYQIEHHLFPDMPSNRYPEIAPRVRELMERYQLHYVTGPLHKQVASAWRTVFRHALPNKSPDRTRWSQITEAARGALGDAAHATRRRLGPRALPALTA